LRSDRELLLDILEAIEKIERYASKGKDALFEDELIQTWIVYHFQIIGEAANHLSDSISGSIWSRSGTRQRTRTILPFWTRPLKIAHLQALTSVIYI